MLGRLKLQSNMEVIVEPTKKHTATILFLHGTEDTGNHILELITKLVGNIKSDYIKFMFPTAPLQPFTPLNGKLSHVWFDGDKLTPDDPEDNVRIPLMAKWFSNIINKEIENGIPLTRIIIGGFSMGGAMALETAYRFMPPMAGCFTLSSFIINDSLIYDVLKKKPISTPLYMCHGKSDELISYDWGKKTFDKLLECNVKAQFNSIPDLTHTLVKSELLELLEWIKEIIPPVSDIKSIASTVCSKQGPGYSCKNIL